MEKALELLEALTNCDTTKYYVRASGQSVIGGSVGTRVRLIYLIMEYNLFFVTVAS